MKFILIALVLSLMPLSVMSADSSLIGWRSLIIKSETEELRIELSDDILITPTPNEFIIESHNMNLILPFESFIGFEFEEQETVNVKGLEEHHDSVFKISDGLIEVKSNAKNDVLSVITTDGSVIDQIPFNGSTQYRIDNLPKGIIIFHTISESLKIIVR